MFYIYDKIRRHIQDSAGATAVEYGVLIALVVAACIVVILVMGDKIANLFSDAANTIGGE
jgi:Flp pilus assembly pilin Flp